MALTEWREYVPTSFEAKRSLDAPTCRNSTLMTAMMLDALTDQKPLLEGKSLMGVVGSHPRSRKRRKMLMPTLTGQAAADSE